MCDCGPSVVADLIFLSELIVVHDALTVTRAVREEGLTNIRRERDGDAAQDDGLFVRLGWARRRNVVIIDVEARYAGV